MIALQFTMFIMIFVGFLVRKLGIVGKEGQKNITDLVIYVILPCNIVKSFMVEFDTQTLYSFAGILLISVLIQAGCVLFGKIVYKNKETNRRKSLQYGIICSNAGFLGNPLAEGVFGTMGLTLASIYLIPQRIMMWSSGLAVFTGNTNKKEVIKKVVTHPCIIACVIGMILMVTQIELPAFLTKSLQTLSNCNTAMSMMVIGMILAQVKGKNLVDKDIIVYTIFRLIIIPLIVWIPCLLLHVDSMVTGVSVLLAAMPAGATTSILASKYGCDEIFATKLVVFSTLASLLTTPIWSYLLV